MNDTRSEIARPVLAALAILGLMLASLWIFRPFLGAFIWATTIVVATWPLLLGLQRRLGGRRIWAVKTLSAVLLAVLFVPFLFSVGAMVANVDDIAAAMQSLSDFKVPPLPAWAAGPPVIGEKLSLMDFEAAGRISGARFVVLKGGMARLHRALIQYMLDLPTAQHGYTEVYAPYLVARQSLVGTGQLPKFEADLFRVVSGDARGRHNPQTVIRHQPYAVSHMPSPIVYVGRKLSLRV